jgi:hypothetical protein
MTEGPQHIASTEAELIEPKAATEEQAELNDLAVGDAAAGQVQGGFNPQPDPPGRA